MRYPAVQKQQTRKQILEVAAGRFRRDGLASVGIKSLMADAGLTHGGFYAHFPNREGLVAEAVATALEDTCALLRSQADAAPVENRLEALIRAYLSTAHRDGSEWGCAAAALAPEVAREPDQAREAFTRGIKNIVKLVAELLPPGGTPGERLERAYMVFSQMMGALQLARAVKNATLSRRLLSDARDCALELANRAWRQAAP